MWRQRALRLNTYFLASMDNSGRTMAIPSKKSKLPFSAGQGKPKVCAPSFSLSDMWVGLEKMF